MIYFNPYNAVDIKDSAEYWEVTALPEGCNTPDGYIRVRFEEDGSVSHYDPGLLTPRFVELPEGTPVDVSGYPVNSQDSQGFWEIVESNPDDQVSAPRTTRKKCRSTSRRCDSAFVSSPRLTIRSIILKVRGSQTASTRTTSTPPHTVCICLRKKDEKPKSPRAPCPPRRGTTRRATSIIHTPNT